MSTPQTYNIDRKAASKLLKISIRTLDRYVKQKKLSTRVVDGRIWLDKKEIEEYRYRQSRQAIVDNVDMSTSNLSIDNTVDKVDSEVDKVDKIEFLDQGISGKITAKKRISDGGVYKKLFEELKSEVAEKQARLEIANYRVGQLEAQVKNSVPMLEYRQESYQREQKELTLKKELQSSKSVIQKIKARLKYAELNKKLLLGILLIVLALQPLWLLWIYK